MRTFGLLATAFLLSFTPAALADSFQFTINSSVQCSGADEDGDNNSYLGFYWTQPDAWGTTESLLASPGVQWPGFSHIPNVSFSLSPGSKITSATMSLVFAEDYVGGTSELFPALDAEHWHVDSDNPISIAPTFGTGGASAVIDGFYPPWDNLGSDLSSLLVINGNEISSGSLDELQLMGFLSLSAPVETPGYNWGGWIGGYGEVNVPYTLEIDGTYTPSPVPEPSSFILLGSGLLVLVAAARRRVRRAC